MKNEQFLDQILEYAYKTGSFSALNIIENAKSVCIWGTGTMFHEAYEHYFVKNEIKVDYLCDNNSEKWGNVYMGITCISPSELENLEDPVVIPLVGDSIPIERQLKNAGIKTVTASMLFFDLIADLERDKEWFYQNIPKIKQTYHFLDDEQSRHIYVNVLCNRIAPELSKKEFGELYSKDAYFGDIGNGYKLGQAESFCDVGACQGDTIQDFLHVTKGQFKEIFAFEMDKENYLECCKLIDKMDQSLKSKIHCWNFGAWDKREKLYFGKEEHGAPESCSILKAENLDMRKDEIFTAQTVPLDEVLKEKQISLLKMDIEGAEQRALRGAQQLIRNMAPNLAICIYHRLDDMWEIPMYIKEIVPEYRLSIRLHSKNSFGDTVCYAYV